jgi:hypothetical protein
MDLNSSKFPQAFDFNFSMLDCTLDNISVPVKHVDASLNMSIFCGEEFKWDGLETLLKQQPGVVVRDTDEKFDLNKIDDLLPRDQRFSIYVPKPSPPRVQLHKLISTPQVCHHYWNI